MVEGEGAKDDAMITHFLTIIKIKTYHDERNDCLIEKVGNVDNFVMHDLDYYLPRKFSRLSWKQI